MLPAGVSKTMELYLNRDNGALIGFYNTSYMTPMSNWTNYTEVEYDDDDHESMMICATSYDDGDGDDDDGRR